MNKIERAIYDTKLRLEDLKRRRMLLIAEINSFEEHLETLETINRNKSIPHIEVEVSKEMSVNLPNLKLEANGTTLTTTNPDGKLGTILINAQNK
jgi:hypothetical protein